MENKVPEIYCKLCYVYQEWKGQKDCVSCGNRLSNWHIAGQLAPPQDKRAS